MKYLLPAICLSVILLSCGQKAGDPLAKLNWLAGTWQHAEDSTHSYEIWNKTNDTLFTGIGFVSKGTDTVFMEHIRIQKRGNEIFYIPTVIGQNNNAPVEFKMLADSNGWFIFENKLHDFPQRIAYTNPVPDSLFAYIEGNTNGKYRRIPFTFTKTK